MSIASAHASDFYEQAAKYGVVYTFMAEDDFLVFPIQGKEVVPFWSSRSRMANVQAAHPKYSAFAISEIPLTEFLGSTLAQFQDEHIHVGVNWSGPRLTGYDLAPSELKRNVEYWLGKIGSEG